MAHRTFTTHPLVVRRVTVRRTQQVTPRLKRITVGGADLTESTTNGHTHRAFAAPGFDDHIKLIFASDGDIDAALPRQLEHGIEWTPSHNRLTRDYTPRRVDLETGEIDLDFVLHGHGPAASWATAAQPGDELCFVGPKSSLRLPEKLDWIVLIADETGLPAVGRFLDERPADAPAHIIALIEDDTAKPTLALRDNDTITWHTAPAGDSDTLLNAIRALQLPQGHGYVWAAAESRALLPARRYFQHEAKIPKERLNITGYWHQPTPTGTAAATPEIPSPLPWLVTRAALDLGIIDALAHQPLTLDALATHTSTTPDTIATLLPILTAHGVITEKPRILTLGPAGHQLLDEHEREELTGLEADTVLALTELATAIRTQTAPWEAAHGHTLAHTASRDAETYEELVEQATRLAYLLDGILEEPLWNNIDSCLLTGPGTPAVIGAMQDNRPDLTLSVLEKPIPTTVLQAAVDKPHTINWHAQPSDIAVLALALAHRTDTEALTLLRQVSEHTDRAILIESSRPDNLNPHAAEKNILAYANTGTPMRGHDALDALTTQTGWRRERIVALGWGIEATFLTRD